jgi:hypothetical protein
MLHLDKPNKEAMSVDFHPDKSSNNAAIRIPIQAPGIFSAIPRRRSRVICALVMDNALICTLPICYF